MPGLEPGSAGCPGIDRSLGHRKNLFVLSFLDESFLTVFSLLLCPDTVYSDDCLSTDGAKKDQK